MWKKLVSLNLALLLLLTLLPINAAAVSDTDRIYATIHRNTQRDDTLFTTIFMFFASGAQLRLYQTEIDFGMTDRVITSYNSQADGKGYTYPLTFRQKYAYSPDKEHPTHLYAQWTEVKGNYIMYVGDGVGPTANGKDYVLKDGLSSGDTVALAGDDLFPSEGGRKIIGWETLDKSPTRYLPGQEITLDSSLVLKPILGSNYITYHYDDKCETVFYDWDEDSWLRDPGIDPVGASAITQKAYLYCKSNNQLFRGWKTSADNDADAKWYKGYVKDAPHDLYACVEGYPTGDYFMYSKFGFDDGSLFQAHALKTDKTASDLGNPPTLAGYEAQDFKGWYNEDLNFIDKDKEVKNETKLEAGDIIYALWYGSYTPPDPADCVIAFDSFNDSSIQYIHLDGDFKLSSQPIIPTRNGYTFNGWYERPGDGDRKVELGEQFAGNQTLYAHWTEDSDNPPDDNTRPNGAYLITFQLLRNSIDYCAYTDENGVLEASSWPSDPASLGWYVLTPYVPGTEQKKIPVSPGDAFSGDAYVYAYSSGECPDKPDPSNPSQKFTVTFDANGGVLADDTQPMTTQDGKLTVLPQDPTREGYTFKGWSTGKDGGLLVSASTVFPQDITVYAQWEKIGGSSGGTTTPGGGDNPGGSTDPGGNDNPGGTTTPGGSDDPSTPTQTRYPIYAPGRVPGGRVSVSHNYATQGTRVTIELDPWSDYDLNWLSVTNLNTGLEVRLTERYRDEYSFIMPASGVEVEAAFDGRYTGGYYGYYIHEEPQTSTKPVKWYYSNGRIQHVTDGPVSLNTPLTRDMLISVLYNMDDSSSGEPEFWATNNNIVPDIYASGLWGPDKAISCEQAAMILFGYAQYKGYDVSPHLNSIGNADYSQIRPIARPAMSWTQAAGLMDVYTSFPRSTLNCGQANSILARFCSALRITKTVSAA